MGERGSDGSKRWVVVFGISVLLAAVHTLAGSTAQAAQGAPDHCGYVWTSSTGPQPRVPFGWLEIKDTGTRITAWTASDDGYAGPLTFGFSFPFYDGMYSEVFVATNGYLSFGAAHSSIPTEAIPSSNPPNNFVMGYGADLHPGNADPPAGGVYYQMMNAPRRFVVEWYDVPHFPNQDPVTFQIILNETGEIWFQYLSLTGSANVVGIESSDGSAGLPYTAAPENNLAIRFAAPAAAPGPVGVRVTPCAQAVSVLPSTQADALLTVANRGTGSDTIDLTFSSPSGWTGTFYTHDGSATLTDTDGDGKVDTGSLASAATLGIRLRVSVPGMAPRTEPATVTATSSVDATVSDAATVIFQLRPGVFSPPHYDFGSDEDADEQFDSLVLGVNVTVTTVGYFSVEGRVHDAAFNLALSSQTFLPLIPGSYTVFLLYAGPAIHAPETDGPYTVDLILRDRDYRPLDTASHTTRAYRYLDFDPPVAVFAPPHEDHGLDLDGDGRFNRLSVDVRLTVTSPARFVLLAALHDPSFGFFVSGSNMSVLEPGSRTLTLSFSGASLNSSGVDGPYVVDLAVYDGETGSFLDSDRHITAPYSHLEFEEIPVLVSVRASVAPTIDGTTLPGEWNYTNAEDLAAISGNGVAALLLVMHDANFLYAAYDAVGDTTVDADDVAAIAFDTGDDGLPTDGREDQFVQGGWVPNDQAHLAYDGPPGFSGWAIEDSPYNPSLPGQEGLAGAWGFGASPSSGVPHRIYEFRIPLALLGTQPDGTLALFGGSQLAPGVYDSSTFRYSLWPIWNSGPLPLEQYGELLLDGTPPSVSIASPHVGATLSANSVTVSWIATDAGSGLDRIEVVVDGRAPVALEAGETSHRVVGLSDGAHTITVTAYDRAGNSDADSVTVTADTTDPTVLIVSPGPGSVVTSSRVTVSFEKDDATSGVDRIDIRQDDGVVQTLASNATSHTITGLADGTHAVTVTVFDRAGNSATATVTFRVDTSIFSPSGPYGVAGIAALVAAVAAATVVTFLLLRRRKRIGPESPPPPT